MRSSIVKIVLLCLFASPVYGIDTTEQENICSEIGFKRKTEAYANCVLELLSREAIPQNNLQSNADDLICKKYGFKKHTNAYAECRQKLEFTKQQALHQQREYEEQKRQYDEQMAQIKKDRDRQRAMKQLELGLRMMGGQSPQDAVRDTAGVPPMPKAPGPLNQTIIMPGGRMVNCTTNGNITNCF